MSLNKLRVKHIEPVTLVLVLIFAFFGGAVDSMVGGGGLIQLPALLVLMPSSPIPTLMGTNKFAFIFGTATAASRYARHVAIPWDTISIAASTAGVAAYFGGRAVSLMDPSVLKPLIFVLLIAVAIWTIKKKQFGTEHTPHHSKIRERAYAVLLGASLGFYDGFFGPGSGSLIIFILISFFGFSFLHATASTKVINCSTNIGAVIYFGMTNQIFWELGLAMAAANSLGALVGSRLVIFKGSQFVRAVFLTIVSLLIFRLGYQILLESFK